MNSHMHPIQCSTNTYFLKNKHSRFYTETDGHLLLRSSLKYPCIGILERALYTWITAIHFWVESEYLCQLGLAEVYATKLDLSWHHSAPSRYSGCTVWQIGQLNQYGPSLHANCIMKPWPPAQSASRQSLISLKCIHSIGPLPHEKKTTDGLFSVASLLKTTNPWVKWHRSLTSPTVVINGKGLVDCIWFTCFRKLWIALAGKQTDPRGASSLSTGPSTSCYSV